MFRGRDGLQSTPSTMLTVPASCSIHSRILLACNDDLTDTFVEVRQFNGKPASGKYRHWSKSIAIDI